MSRRLARRLGRHHLPLLLASVLSTTVLYVTRPYTDVLSKLSFATAYPALALLTVTLLIGPWHVLRRQRMPVSSDLRRDVGIWAGVMGLIHAGVGQCVHLRGRPWLYYVYERGHGGPQGLRHDLFGLNNFTGLLGTVVLVVLFATSNDWSLKRLKTPGWKQLQRWNYACFVLAGVHAIGYQVMEKQQRGFVATVLICVAATALLQGAVFVVRWRMAHYAA